MRGISSGSPTTAIFAATLAAVSGDTPLMFSINTSRIQVDVTKSASKFPDRQTSGPDAWHCGTDPWDPSDCRACSRRWEYRSPDPGSHFAPPPETWRRRGDEDDVRRLGGYGIDDVRIEARRPPGPPRSRVHVRRKLRVQCGHVDISRPQLGDDRRRCRNAISDRITRRGVLLQRRERYECVDIEKTHVVFTPPFGIT
jgi:hypothetical protein